MAKAILATAATGAVGQRLLSGLPADGGRNSRHRDRLMARCKCSCVSHDEHASAETAS